MKLQKTFHYSVTGERFSELKTLKLPAYEGFLNTNIQGCLARHVNDSHEKQNCINKRLFCERSQGNHLLFFIIQTFLEIEKTHEAARKIRKHVIMVFFRIMRC